MKISISTSSVPFVGLSLGNGFRTLAKAEDPLTSWAEGTARSVIIPFVQ
jgi:hypothetical protein